MIPAVIVAGGRGERMGSATADLPKPMLPFGGRPILEHLIERLAAAGWREPTAWAPADSLLAPIRAVVSVAGGLCHLPKAPVVTRSIGFTALMKGLAL